MLQRSIVLCALLSVLCGVLPVFGMDRLEMTPTDILNNAAQQLDKEIAQKRIEIPRVADRARVVTWRAHRIVAPIATIVGVASGLGAYISKSRTARGYLLFAGVGSLLAAVVSIMKRPYVQQDIEEALLSIRRSYTEKTARWLIALKNDTRKSADEKTINESSLTEQAKQLLADAQKVATAWSYPFAS